jgi:hypothetical protein
MIDTPAWIALMRSSSPVAMEPTCSPSEYADTASDKVIARDPT